MYDITSGLKCIILKVHDSLYHHMVGSFFLFSVSCSPDTSRPEEEKCHGIQSCQLTSVTTLSKFLNEMPNTKFPRKEAKTSARVLTSNENRKMLEEKETKKKEALEEKEKKKKGIEEKNRKKKEAELKRLARESNCINIMNT